VLLLLLLLLLPLLLHQDDVLLPTTTPREALAFTAALRLPGRCAAARSARAAAVAGMLSGMALSHCADTLVRMTLPELAIQGHNAQCCSTKWSCYATPTAVRGMYH
jgi:hypothetical protein